MTEMYECPYSPGLQCNQRKRVCDKALLEPHCFISILGNISRQLTINQDYIKKEGMLEIIDWMFDNNFIRQKHYNLSVMDIIERFQEFKESQVKKEIIKQE